jgi:hypothetical protein
MSLAVPLTARIGRKHITAEVSGLAFTKNAVGGLQSISLRLARPLARFDVDLSPMVPLSIYDARSAVVIAQGRLADPGRAAASGDGEQWDIVAFGPAQTAAARTFPYVVVDQSLDAFRRSNFSDRNASTDSGEVGTETPALEIRAEEGKTVAVGWMGDMINRVMRDANQKLARVKVSIDAGITNANYRQQIVTRTGTGSSNLAANAGASTAGSAISAVVVTDFPDGDDVISVRATRDTSGTTGAEVHWFAFYDVVLRAMLRDSSGASITTGYASDTVLAHEVVNDLLGRVLDQFDGANASVDTGASYAIDQMSYPDGVTAEKVLEDLMALEPAYRWYGTPDVTGGGYAFRWGPWPTRIRYEASLDDGGSFPASSQELYNKVTVRWLGANGIIKAVTLTGSCPTLDAAGIVQSTLIDASDEVGSTAAATRLGQNFLAEHRVPANAGSLTVARPIRDLITGRMVRPHELEPGELIRVKGVESYPDALNASSSDGQTVFRIWSMSYTSDSDSASLELDTWSRSTTNALRSLAKRRNRKR